MSDRGKGRDEWQGKRTRGRVRKRLEGSGQEGGGKELECVGGGGGREKESVGKGRGGGAEDGLGGE